MVELCLGTWLCQSLNGETRGLEKFSFSTVKQNSILEAQGINVQGITEYNKMKALH